MPKKIKNSTTPQNNAVPDMRVVYKTLYDNKNFMVDFSFADAFKSCTCGNFSNMLEDQVAFINQFRIIIECINVLTDRTTEEVFRDFRHCHKVTHAQKTAKVKEVITYNLKRAQKSDDYCEQLLGGEDFYQIGLHGTVRLYGLLHGNIFSVYLIDYYHDIYYNEHYNERNKQQCKFCPMNTPLG